MLINYLQELEKIANENGGIIQSKVAEEHGISKAMLHKLYCKNNISRLAKGQYILTNNVPDELYSISIRSEKFIFSHETALFLHGLSDRTPFVHSITAPSGSIPSHSIKTLCKVYYIKEELLFLGKIVCKTPYGNDVSCYDLERTICDIVRSRNKLGVETFISALKQYALSPNKDLNRLDVYSKSFNVSKIIRNYLEVLL